MIKIHSCKQCITFRKDIIKHVDKVILAFWFHFMSFHIWLNLTVTDFRIFLKYHILTRWIILLCFLHVLTICSLRVFWQSTVLYSFTVSATFSVHYETDLSLSFIQKMILFVRLSVNFRRYFVYCFISVVKSRWCEIQMTLFLFLTVFLFIFFHALCLNIFHLDVWK